MGPEPMLTRYRSNSVHDKITLPYIGDFKVKYGECKWLNIVTQTFKEKRFSKSFGRF